MSAAGNDLTDFIEALQWSGKHRLEILLYALRDRSQAPLAAPDVSLWPQPTTIKQFELADDLWPVVIDLFEIYTPSLPEDYIQRFTELLAYANGQGAILAWYMYEGAFGAIGDLFSPWQVAQTYGIVFSGHAPVLAIRHSERQHPTWQSILTDASDFLYTHYPELKTFSNNSG